ncbi:MAG: beta-mannosidase [Oscillospiraceae bacterium]|nr:beta-mannosidase [Oscillospiraceae bacterium]
MSKFLQAVALFIICVAFFVGCNKNDDVPDAPETDEIITETPVLIPAFLPPEAVVNITLTADEAELFGNVRLSGDYLEGFEQISDYCVFTALIPADGFYDLNFISVGIGGTKENYITVNGERLGTVFTGDDDFGDAVFERVFLTEGQNSIALERYWGWIRLRSLHITNSEPLDPAIFDVSARLINPDANETARRLMSYLADSYGKVILSGQYSDHGLLAGEAGVIFMTTGKRPAVLGMDMIEYSPSRAERGNTSSTVEHAIEAWAEHGAIVTLCWHWNAPSEYIRERDTWYKAFYTSDTNINLEKIMNGEDPEGYGLLMRDIDVIAEELKRLQDADVPILWRPLHEAAGGWFWWGAGGREPYIELWKLLYERLTFEHGLNNLIWLWNGEAADWYPGDDYVDIIGEDIYAGERVYSSQIHKFTEAVSYADTPKIVTLSENGTLFDPDLALRDGAMWGFWATWGGEFVVKRGLWSYSEQFTEEEMLIKAYNHEIVVTLEDLPDLKTYPIRG